MIKLYKNPTQWGRLMAGGGMVALAVSVASPALAQRSSEPQAAARNAELSEIVVTARRVNESLQEVPVSVGTIDAAELSNRAITGLQDLKGAIAGVTTSRTTTPGGGYVTIRGKTGSATPTPSGDSSVGFYLDGVYVAGNQGAGTAIPDLARVEVLRGPQGTLFGRNNSAGAINFITNEPTFDHELKFGLLYGNYDELRATATVNLPITDTLAIRASYLHEEYAGDVKNTTDSPGYNLQGYGSFTPEKEMNSSNTESFIARVRWEGVPDLRVDYKFDYVRQDASPAPNQIIGFIPSALSPTLGSLFPAQPPGFVTPSFTRLGALAEDFHGPSQVTNMGHQLTLDYKISPALSVKSITAWRSSKSGGNFDLDGGDWQIFLPPTLEPTSFCVNCTDGSYNQDQFSQELQLIGEYDRGSYIAGLYYFNQRASYNTLFPLATIIPESPAVYVPPQTPFVGAGLGPLALAENGDYRNRSYAGYGHAEYDLVDRVRLAVGARYTIDKREASDKRPFSLSQDNVKYEKFNYDIALNFQATPDVMFYGKYSDGYISGGIYKSISFRPETLKQAELGFKSEFWDRRVRLNASAYYTWIEDKQVSVTSTNPGSNPILADSGFVAPFPLGVITYNLPGQSTIKGFEIEATVRPVEALTLTANYGYNKPKEADGGKPRAPQTTFSFSAQYDLPTFDNGMYFSLRFDGDYRGKYYGTGLTSDEVYTGTLPASLLMGYADSASYFDALKNATISGDYWLINGRLSLFDIPMDGANARLGAYVRNIFDEQGLLYAVNYGGSIGGAFERPRQYGIELNLDW